MKKLCKNVKFDKNYDYQYVMWNRQIETWCVDWKNIMKKKWNEKLEENQLLTRFNEI